MCVCSCVSRRVFDCLRKILGVEFLAGQDGDDRRLKYYMTQFLFYLYVLSFSLSLSLDIFKFLYLYIVSM